MSKQKKQPEVVELSWGDVLIRAQQVARTLYKSWQHKEMYLYGVPNGGIFAAQTLLTELVGIDAVVRQTQTFENKRRKPVDMRLLESIGNEVHDVVIVDDVIDSGR